MNGLPLLVIEFKKPGVSARVAFGDNLTHYKAAIPQLFWSNAFLIASNGTASRIGSLSADWERFFEWKRIESEIARARRNPLWTPMPLILARHMAERGEASQVENDPGLADFVLLITILVAFVETAARTVRPLQPSLTLTLDTGIRQHTDLAQQSSPWPT